MLLTLNTAPMKHHLFLAAAALFLCACASAQTSAPAPGEFTLPQRKAVGAGYDPHNFTWDNSHILWRNASGVVGPLGLGEGLDVVDGELVTTGGGGEGSGTVTSVSGSGGTTGLTLSGGPITSSGTLTLGGTLNLANGGTGASLTDPNNDRGLFWDDSAGSLTWLTYGTGLTVSGTTLSVNATTISSGVLSVEFGGTGLNITEPPVGDRVYGFNDETETWAALNVGGGIHVNDSLALTLAFTEEGELMAGAGEDQAVVIAAPTETGLVLTSDMEEDGLMKWAAAGGGGGTVTDPGVAYVRSDGNDTTGNGSPSAPFATLQAAINHASNFTRFDLGVGSFGTGDFSARAALGPVVIRGRGPSTVVTNLIYRNSNFAFTLHCIGGMTATAIYTDGAAGSGEAARNITIYGDASLTVQFVSAVGGEGGAGDELSPSGTGGNGANITLVGPFRVTTMVDVAGGFAGADGGGGSGGEGNPGQVMLTRGVEVESLNPDTTSVRGAIISGTWYDNTYP